MRVTAGRFKGITLAKNPYNHIRPTQDIVKQAIFNSLASRFVSKPGKAVCVLDLFCGTGALGIEALSRGAEVVFVDKDTRSVNLTKDNLKTISATATVIRASFDVAIKKLCDEKFDIILLDPPYKAGLYSKALELVRFYRILSNDGVVVCEHDKKEEFDHEGYEVLSTKKYGSKIVTYLAFSEQ